MKSDASPSEASARSARRPLRETDPPARAAARGPGRRCAGAGAARKRCCVVAPRGRRLTLRQKNALVVGGTRARAPLSLTV
jgi:hypothetical protein